jgi:hypothetical protein
MHGHTPSVVTINQVTGWVPHNREGPAFKRSIALRDLAKKVLMMLAPSIHRVVQRRFGHSGAFQRVETELRANAELYMVRAGPFDGMRYVREATCSSLYPKLLGCYEMEIHHIIINALRRPYDVVIDVGSAEGYYAVGFALRSACKNVIAYDSDPNARQLCAELSRLNGCEGTVSVRGACDVGALSAALQGRCLIICDCEGYEQVLLNPVKIPGLRSADILVELHDCFYPNLSKTLLHKFDATHTIEIVAAVERQPGQSPYLARLKGSDQRAAMSEGRPGPMTWAWMQPKLAASDCPHH